jgi:MFS family permease
MFFHFSPTHLFNYFLKREANQFFVSIAIRSLAIGMVLIFEPIYLYSYFDSFPMTLLFFAAIHGLFGVLAVFGGKLMAKIGLKHVMLLSHFFFFSYFLSLFFIYNSFFLIPLAVILKAIGMTLFWPAFHTDFTRFSEKGYQGRAVGKINVIITVPAIVGPVIGGAVLSVAGYPALFIAVLVILLASSIPMLLSKETHVVYSDSFKEAWQRVFKKENWKTSLGLITDSFEAGINTYLWPLFMFVLAISYATMGEITTFALAVAALFALYMGRVSDTIINRVWFLNVGSVLTSIAWILKYFVRAPFDAFLADTLYRVCRGSASIPFQTFFYRKASLKGAGTDEFIIYREIVINLSYLFSLMLLAGILFFIPQINIAFIVAAIVSLGFVFMGVPLRFKW